MATARRKTSRIHRRKRAYAERQDPRNAHFSQSTNAGGHTQPTSRFQMGVHGHFHEGIEHRPLSHRRRLRYSRHRHFCRLWLALLKAPGDHRFAIVEIDDAVLVGEPLLKIVRPQARRLACSVPNAKKRYLKLLEGHFSSHRVMDKAYELAKERDQAFSPAQCQRLQRLDKIREEGMKFAEKRCRKFAMGKVDYSPTIANVRLQRFIWKRVIARKDGKNVKTLTLQRKARLCGISNPTSASRAEAVRNFEEADEEYARLKRVAPDLRREFLLGRAHNDAGDVPIESQKAARRQLRVERQRKDSRHLRRVLGKPQGGAITKIEVWDSEIEEYVEKTDQHEIETLTMEMCENRFRLTENTPPMTEPLCSELGYLGTTDAAKQILAGTYECPPGTDMYTREFISGLKACSELGTPTIPTKITFQEWQTFWRKCNERTSSSISGLHYGHYKAAADSDFLSEIHAILTQLAVTGQCPFECWQAGLSCMLEKKAGLIVVEKLRAILLMEADFNCFNGLMLARRMMHHAEDNGWIPDEIFGSRAYHEAIEVALLRMLVADYVRLVRIAMAIASVDANTCYDRIAHAIASICAQRWDVDPVVITTMLYTIQMMKFFLRTGFGDSASFFGRNPLPLQGVCQGNKGGPAMWLCVSVILVIMLHRLGHVSNLHTALSGLLVVFAGFLFVDDTDLVLVASSPDETPEQVAERMERAVDAWQGGLRATGGDLKDEKCSWCLIGFAWDNGEPVYSNETNLPADIAIRLPNGQRTPISRYNPSQSIKVVGVHQAMDGNMAGQLAALKEKADNLAEKIKAGWLPRHLVHQGFRSMIWTSLKYPLPATTFTPAQGKEITSNLCKAILPRMGANRNFPLAYRHAPPRFQGLDLPEVYLEQEIGHISSLVTHGTIDSLPGKLLRLTMEQIQLEVGIGTPFLQAPFKEYGFLATRTVLTVLWEFVSTHGITLRYSKQVLPELQRAADDFIMERLVESQCLDQKELIGCNRCRPYLQAMTMADITSGDGARIDEDIFNTHRPHMRESKRKWPVSRPTNEDKAAWKKGLKLLSSETRWIPITDRLGCWTRTPHLLWEWYYDPVAQRLYRQVRLHRLAPVSWHLYIPYDTANTRHCQFVRSEAGIPPPTNLPDLHLATAFINQVGTGMARLEGSAPFIQAQSPIFTDIRDLVDSWGSEAWSLQDMTLPDQPALLAAAIENGTALG